MNIARYISGPRHPLGPVGLEDAKAVLNSLVRMEVLRQEMVDLADGATTRAIRLNRTHPFVQQVLAEWQTRTAARVAVGPAGSASDETADDEDDEIDS